MDNKIVKLLKSSSGYTIGSVANRALFMFSMPIMTRYLTPADYGVLSVVNVVIGIMMTLYGLAANDFIIRFYYEQDSEDDRKKFLGAILTFIISTTLVVSVGLTLFGEKLFGVFFPDISFYPYMVIGIWVCFVHMFEMVPDALFRIRNEVILFITVNFTKSILVIVMSVLAVVVLKRGAEGPLAASLGTDIIIGFFFFYYLKDKVRLGFSLDLVLSCLKFSLPVLSILLGSVLLESADRLMLQRYVDMAVVGQYSIGATLASVLIMIASSMDIAWTPFFYSTAKSETEQSAKDIFSQAATYLFAAILFCAMVPIILRNEIVFLLAPPSYYPVIEVVPLIMIGAAINGIFFIPVRGIYLKKKTFHLPLIIVIGIVSNVALNFWLIPRYGMYGAATATIIAAFLMLLTGFIIAQCVYPIRYQYHRMGVLVVTCFVCFGLGQFIEHPLLVVRLVMRLGILAVFPMVMFSIGMIKKDAVLTLFFKSRASEQ